MSNQFKVFCLTFLFLGGIHAMHQQESAPKRVELNDEFKKQIRAEILAEIEAKPSKDSLGAQSIWSRELFHDLFNDQWERKWYLKWDQTFWEKLLRSVTDWGLVVPVRMLIEAGVNVNSTPDDEPALVAAARHGHYEIALILIQAGAIPNSSNVDKFTRDSRWIPWTALMLAAGNGITYNLSPSYLSTCELLVEKMLSIPNASQKDRLYTFLNCLKRKDAIVGGGSYCHLRNVFKPYLQAMIREENMPWVYIEIKRIDRAGYSSYDPKRSHDAQLIKQQLLNKYINMRVVEESERMLESLRVQESVASEVQKLVYF